MDGFYILGESNEHREEAKRIRGSYRTKDSPNNNYKFSVAMRLGETPVHIPNTMVKT